MIALTIKKLNFQDLLGILISYLNLRSLLEKNISGYQQYKIDINYCNNIDILIKYCMQGKYKQ
jgi:hypothetical protein